MRKYLLLTVFFVSLIVALTLGGIPQGRGATRLEISKADDIIRAGISSHFYYLKFPELQTSYSGNTTYNLEWVSNYVFLKGLLDRAYRQ